MVFNPTTMEVTVGCCSKGWEEFEPDAKEKIPLDRCKHWEMWNLDVHLGCSVYLLSKRRIRRKVALWIRIHCVKNRKRVDCGVAV